MKLVLFMILGMGNMLISNAQTNYWQQHVNYEMFIDFNVDTHRFKGNQILAYTNNSPDTISQVFYHLYFNAFQPGSMMDLKNQNIKDPDFRLSKISTLKDAEIGYHKISELLMEGMKCQYSVEGTILEVNLPKKILPGETVTFKMKFESQVPVQIRRNGRDNAEGISYSMAQWYPKLCEYDVQGWHANPYISREFYGVWGDYKVHIEIDRKYTVAAGGLVENPEKMGHGYSEKDTKTRPFLGKKKLCWTFIANNVHDFVWAADPDYRHLIYKTDLGTELHYFFDINSANIENWEDLHAAMNVAEKFMNKRYGIYPYPVYHFIQGGDGGMEYPLATLITGNRNYSSLVGVSIHEWMHSWYQMMLGTNESLYSWMDEGFTSFATAEVMNHLRKENIIPGKYTPFPAKSNLRKYAMFSQSGYEEALSIHSDHFVTNQAYGAAAYTKGNVFLAHLEYIVGVENFAIALKRYFNDWKFKHPTPNDLIRVFEKTSKLQLDWFKEYMVYTTHTIDYGIGKVSGFNNSKSVIELNKIGRMPMPVDLRVTTSDGKTYDYNIPLRIMRGSKTGDIFKGELCKDWPWTHPNYALEVNIPYDQIESVSLDPDLRMADIDLQNNSWTKPQKKEAK